MLNVLLGERGDDFIKHVNGQYAETKKKCIHVPS